MTRFFKYIKGWLRIKVWGFSPERFMNLCSNRGILLWDISKEGDIYEMCISINSFYKLKPIVKKTRTRVVILQRYGLPFLIPKLLKRKIFLTGLVLTVLFWLVSSLYIWDIQISGNYQITTDVFESFLETQQVYIGMRKENLDIETLEKEIRKQFPKITWTSAKLSGTRLIIELKENDAPIISSQEEETTGKDLVAEYNGVISSMIVRKGTPKVSIGDTVEKGTVLVEGKVPVYNEDQTIREYIYVTADADIMLEHDTSFQEKLPLDYVEKTYTGRTKKRYFLRIGEKEWKMPTNRPFLVYDSIISKSQPLFFEKLKIPIFLGTYTYREYQNVEHEYTLEQATEILKEKLNTFLTTLNEKGVQIIEKDVKIDSNGSMWVIQGNFHIKEPVGKSVDTTKDDIGEQELNE